MPSGSLIPSYPPLTEFTRPYAEKFNLTTLPLHIHEVLFAVVFLCISAAYFEIFGVGFLMHALSAVVVFALGFRPFINFYGPVFILFELSSPFLNFHWFFDKLNMTGSKPQLYNGVLLLTVFFFCRVVWGPYQSIKVYRDVYNAYMNPPLTREEGIPIPTWLVLVYLGSNILLNSLNYYWFSRMIETVRKRFSEPKVEAKEAKKVL